MTADRLRPELVASCPTPAGARWIAARLHGLGIRAMVRPPCYLADIPTIGWGVLVGGSEADPARQLLLADHLADLGPELARCGGCAYDLEGLQRPAVCPECGRNLAEDRAAVRRWSVRLTQDHGWSERQGSGGLVLLAVAGCALGTVLAVLFSAERVAAGMGMLLIGGGVAGMFLPRVVDRSVGGAPAEDDGAGAGRSRGRP